MDKVGRKTRRRLGKAKAWRKNKAIRRRKATARQLIKRMCRQALGKAKARRRRADKAKLAGGGKGLCRQVRRQVRRYRG